MAIETDVILCECCSTEHQILFLYDKEDKEAWMEIHLVKYSFWYRLKYGIKYIFGYKSRYGAFDEIILHEGCKEKMQRVIDIL